MSTPFLAEIRLMSFSFAPKGWAQCNGQLLAIVQNQALFSLLGTTYGGNGQTTFALPNLQGRVPIHRSDSHPLGDQAGERTHALTIAELPTHTHLAMASSTDADASLVDGNVLAAAANAYAAAGSLAAVDTATVSTVGGNQPHLNMQPYLTLSFCIALQGIFPSRN